MKNNLQAIELIKHEFNRILPVKHDPAGACLIWAIAACNVLHGVGKKVCLQAGNCQWPRITPEQDDGECSTHFGYVWSPLTRASILAMHRGHLPEIHVWNALPDEQIIIDMSAGFFPKQCQDLIGQDWPGNTPPDHLWCEASDIPNGVWYEAVPEAMAFIFNYVHMCHPELYHSTFPRFSKKGEKR